MGPPAMSCHHLTGSAIHLFLLPKCTIQLPPPRWTFARREIQPSDERERMRRADGARVPVLSKLPFFILRNALLGFGCCTPATKKVMNCLMRSKLGFGILPGGIEDVALYERGKERIYIRNRARFMLIMVNLSFPRKNKT